MISSADINRLRQDPSNVDETSFHLPLQITPPPHPFLLCSYTMWLAGQPALLFGFWLGLANGGRNSRDREKGMRLSHLSLGFLPIGGRLYPSTRKDASFSRQPSWQDAVLPGSCTHALCWSHWALEVGTSLQLPALGVLHHPCCCPYTVPTQFQCYLTLSDYPVWGCYLFFCRDSDSPLRT